MENGISEVLSVVWKIGGPLVGIFLGRYWTRNKDQVGLTMEFFKEQRSESFAKVSMSLTHFLDAKVGVQSRNEIVGLYSIENREALTHLLLIEGFYARMWVCLKNNQLKNDMILKLFPRNFYYWYYRYPDWFAYQDGLEGLSDQPMYDLSEWFQKHLPTETHESLKRIYLRSN